MPEQEAPLGHVPASRTVAKRQTRLSPVWIIPIVAAIAGVWVGVTKIRSEGPTITIDFRTAEGLEAGKTRVHYNGVVVGTVATIKLSDDHARAIATVQMTPGTEGFLVDDTRFWVVRPRISGANVSGLGTLISGAYIGMEIGDSPESKREFVALETPPVVTHDVPGRYFTLKTTDLGSLDSGTPLFFRRLRVGEVVSYQLDEDGRTLDVSAFVNAPYDQFVTPNTRFWHASGIDLSLSAEGLRVQTQSALSILVGGIAFETAATAAVLPPAEANTVFTLFANRVEAFKLPSRDPQTYLLIFKESSVRGLAPGAPVEFRGIPIGEVVEIGAHVDAETLAVSVPAVIRLDPERLGLQPTGVQSDADLIAMHRRLIDTLVSRGMRAQLRTGSLLTGALFVAFDVFPNAPAATVDWSGTPVELPTLPGELAAIEATVASILKKVDQMPLQTIGNDLAKAIAELDRTLASARGTLDNAGGLIGPNSELRSELSSTLQEVSGAARSLRLLADYLEQHPEALLRGKTGGNQ